jgi:hypothetical protein
MAGFSTSTLKITARGNLHAVQNWSTSFWVGLNAGSDASGPNLLPVAVAIEGAVKTWANGLAGHIWASNTQYEGITAYLYPPLSTVSTENAPATSGPVSGSETGYEPFQISLVASLRTPFSGRSYRGRMYVPLSATLCDNSGQLGSAPALYLSETTAALFEAVNTLDLTAHGVTGQTCVVASFTKAQTFPITTVIVDSIPDTQRRRENALVATYVESTPVT